MRRDVHLKALRAASHVAFSVALLGCGAAQDDAAANDTPGDDAPTTAAEADLHGKAKPKHGSKAGTGSDDATSCHDAGPATPPDCNAVLDGAFPKPSGYPGEKKSVSSDVKTCCLELLSGDATFVSDANHRWDCCANVTIPAGAKNAIACTPWGPPVPPAMKARATAVA